MPQSVLAQDNSHLVTDSPDALPCLRVNAFGNHTFILSVYFIRIVLVSYREISGMVSLPEDYPFYCGLLAYTINNKIFGRT
jgi:hypothetical protein